MGSKRKQNDGYDHDPIRHIEPSRPDRNAPADEDDWDGNPNLSPASRLLLNRSLQNDLRWQPRLIKPDTTQRAEVEERAGFTPLPMYHGQDTRWLWPGRIPYGSLLVILGPAGSGKSRLVHDLMARVSRGTPWPESPGEARKPADVVWVGSEFQPVGFVAEEVRCAGGDLRRIQVVNCIEVRLPSGTTTRRPLKLPDDITHLEWLRCDRTATRLFVIDPLDSFVCRGNARSQIGMLQQLRHLATRSSTAVVCVLHWPTRTTWQNVDQLVSRHPLAEVADVIWYVDRFQPREPERLLGVIKSPSLLTRGSGTLLRMVEQRLEYDQSRPVWYARRQPGELNPSSTGTRLEQCMKLILELTATEPLEPPEIVERLLPMRQRRATIYRALAALRRQGQLPIPVIDIVPPTDPPPDKLAAHGPGSRSSSPESVESASPTAPHPGVNSAVPTSSPGRREAAPGKKTRNPLRH